MKKLIELLNEYTYGENKELYYRDAEIVDINSDRVISKKFGFIKWLVDNNKVDFNKLEKIGYIGTVYRYDGQYRDIIEYSNYERLLMLLSIQDEPIRFLCEILK